MKKILFLLLAVLFFACSTVHKSTTTTKQNVDSTSVLSKDTSSLNKVIANNDDFSAKGVDITLNYDSTTGDVKWTPLNVPKGQIPSSDKDYVAQEVAKEALSNLPSTGRLPSSVTIHIDSLGNNDKTVTTINANDVKTQDSAHIKTATTTKVATKSRTGLSAGVYIIGGIVVLAGLIFLAIKLGVKFI
jgi:uncharacterized protein YxeA